MILDPDQVFAKTPLASDELATRRHHLNPRIRQLLILVDGRRTLAQLARLIPSAELQEHLPMLERRGFIARTDGLAGSPALSPVTHPGPAPLPAAPRPLPAAPQPQAQPLPAGAGTPHDEMRERLVAALAEVIGEQGAELAQRIENCRSRRELREILPAALAIVEVVGGARALAQFEERAGLR